MKFIIGKKVGMTQIYEGDKIVPVTVVEAGPCLVSQIKSKDTDGYESWQLAFGKTKHIARPQKGHLKNLGDLAHMKEFRFKQSPPEKKLSIGDTIDASWFSEGEEVKVAGLSKGRGFMGVVKRHGFSGGPASHGQKHQHRAPGSIGGGFPERVTKGRRMAGRSGSEKNIIKSEIVKIDKDNNLIAFKGALPGRRGTILTIVSK
ncbi:MAG: 50S ribosomal protein L3 [Candidatus Portnoybacteria bacterium CG10_big_fil_rev_8_21_14_0_10_36_7]|uniref:50S ribosomal protein L3 n=1 Tax=Candidatus Portnoybacteria bacterium CG10_big_fil_rev_8_21_14_0_10_36_7 TaxID=1974812 RepID=A0A2M8KDE7_9BACT|nr:MAG: 50S ribosomal protein L3 [Candidatus Portnoybacteria bacterium CG10_big_fil_rev_8_21_14_0_10_36_7]